MTSTAFHDDPYVQPPPRPADVLDQVVATTDPALPQPDDAAQSTSMSTTTPMTDLLESAGVLGLAAAIPLLSVGGLAAGGAAVGAIVALCVARRLRGLKAVKNEKEMTKPRFAFSKAQLAAACAPTSALPPEAIAVLKGIPPDVRLSQWQLTTLLAAHMGQGRAAEVLPLVVRFASYLSTE